MIQVYIDICLPSTKSFNYFFFYMNHRQDILQFFTVLHIKIYNIP